MCERRTSILVVFFWIGTLTAVASVLDLCLIPTVRARLIDLQSRAQIRRMEDEGVTEVVKIYPLRIPVPLTVPLSVTKLSLRLIIAISKPLLEECSNIIGDSLQFLVALCLCSLEATGYMTPDKRHRNCI
jgi:hypothetical protein